MNLFQRKRELEVVKDYPYNPLLSMSFFITTKVLKNNYTDQIFLCRRILVPA